MPMMVGDYPARVPLALHTTTRSLRTPAPQRSRSEASLALGWGAEWVSARYGAGAESWEHARQRGIAGHAA